MLNIETFKFFVIVNQLKLNDLLIINNKDPNSILHIIFIKDINWKGQGCLKNAFSYYLQYW